MVPFCPPGPSVHLHGAWPFSLHLRLSSLTSGALAAERPSFFLSSPLPRTNFWVFSQIVSFSWRILLVFFTRPTSTYTTKPSSEAFSSQKPRLEKMPFVYISTVLIFTLNKCLSTLLQLLVLLVSSIYLGAPGFLIHR